MKALNSSMYFFPFKLLFLTLISTGTAGIRITMGEMRGYIHHVIFRYIKLIAGKTNTTSLLTNIRTPRSQKAWRKPPQKLESYINYLPSSHWITKRLWRSSSLTPLLKAGPSIAGCPGSCLIRFWLSPRTETSPPLQATHVAFDHPHNKKTPNNPTPHTHRKNKPQIFLK